MSGIEPNPRCRGRKKSTSSSGLLWEICNLPHIVPFLKDRSQVSVKPKESPRRKEGEITGGRELQKTENLEIREDSPTTANKMSDVGNQNADT